MSKNHYPKIDTLYVRDDDFKVSPFSEVRHPEFLYIKDWLWMEKIDGSNISIVDNVYGTFWRGRTDNANFTKEVVAALNSEVTRLSDGLDTIRREHGLDSIEVFGEIYGPKIQSGGIYSDSIRTTYYDIRIEENLWLGHEDFIKNAEFLNLKVPAHGVESLDRLVSLASSGFDTLESGGTGGRSEGIIAKTLRPLYMNDGNRLMFKLKTKDFRR